MTVLTSMMTIYKQQWRNERHSAIVACQTISQSVLLSVFMCQVSLRSAEITSEFLEDGLLCRSVTLEIVTLLHLFERCLLLLCQCLRNIHADVYHEVSGAMSVALYRRQSLAPSRSVLPGCVPGSIFIFTLPPLMVGTSTCPPRAAVGKSRSRL